MGSDGSTPLREKELLRFRRVRSVEIERKEERGEACRGIYRGLPDIMVELDIGQLATLGS
ncbi:hypothetical protein TorRG33x02_199720 [Trema orientale]|uniref:Uncharacterized protein n=1 Tax=Trema orientale TaxID=63057 RepID=A0A2P5EFB4_TREOI|nr:hypothetical protein TorRG33x02_199720 [Trema orientale]